MSRTELNEIESKRADQSTRSILKTNLSLRTCKSTQLITAPVSLEVIVEIEDDREDLAIIVQA